MQKLCRRLIANAEPLTQKNPELKFCEIKESLSLRDMMSFILLLICQTWFNFKKCFERFGEQTLKLMCYISAELSWDLRYLFTCCDWSLWNGLGLRHIQNIFSTCHLHRNKWDSRAPRTLIEKIWKSSSRKWNLWIKEPVEHCVSFHSHRSNHRKAWGTLDNIPQALHKTINVGQHKGWRRTPDQTLKHKIQWPRVNS